MLISPGGLPPPPMNVMWLASRSFGRLVERRPMPLHSTCVAAILLTQHPLHASPKVHAVAVPTPLVKNLQLTFGASNVHELTWRCRYRHGFKIQSRQTCPIHVLGNPFPMPSMKAVSASVHVPRRWARRQIYCHLANSQWGERTKTVPRQIDLRRTLTAARGWNLNYSGATGVLYGKIPYVATPSSICFYIKYALL